MDASELDIRNPWADPPNACTVGNLTQWYKGDAFNRLPPRDQQTLAELLRGWTPETPIISQDTRVVGIGSCFAQYFLTWLAENGFNRNLDQSPHNSLIRYGNALENPAVIAQKFRWAFEGLDNAAVTWIGKDRERFDATEERRELVRRTLLNTDVLVLSLGLSETWYDQQTGEPLWRTMPQHAYVPGRHVFRVESLASTRASLEKIEELRARHAPNMRIVFTVSPIRLLATFRPVSALTANSASKAILRASLDEFLRGHADKLNRNLFYFPSYEIVHDLSTNAFEADNRHITEAVSSRIVRCFVETFCDAALQRTDPLDTVASMISRLRQSEHEVDRRLLDLHRLSELETAALKELLSRLPAA
jgi:hypothetical protein